MSYITTNLCTASALAVHPDGYQIIYPGFGLLEELPFGFAFETSDINKAVTRNYKWHAFNIEGDVTGETQVSGYTTSPGLGGPTIGGPTPVGLTVILNPEDILVGPTSMPNFARETRFMLNWLGSFPQAQYPNDFATDHSTTSGIYPLMQLPDGTALGGGLLIAYVSILGTLTPYLVKYNGNYYTYHDISLGMFIRAEFPGQPTAILETGTSIGTESIGFVFSNTPGLADPAHTFSLAGGVEIVDQTREGSIGSVPLYRDPAGIVSANMAFVMRQNYTAFQP